MGTSLRRNVTGTLRLLERLWHVGERTLEGRGRIPFQGVCNRDGGCTVRATSFRWKNVSPDRPRGLDIFGKRRRVIQYLFVVMRIKLGVLDEGRLKRDDSEPSACSTEPNPPVVSTTYSGH